MIGSRGQDRGDVGRLGRLTWHLGGYAVRPLVPFADCVLEFSDPLGDPTGLGARGLAPMNRLRSAPAWPWPIEIHMLSGYPLDQFPRDKRHEV
jgi:hypothetical protein